MDPDQDPDPNCLQRLSADNKSGLLPLARKELTINNLMKKVKQIVPDQTVPTISPRSRLIWVYFA